jgi:RimJ/RimL family protein N-acetyltransferase
MKRELLFTSRLDLEPQIAAHGERLFDLFQDPDIYTFITRVPPSSKQKFCDDISFIEKRFLEKHSEQWLNWVMVERDTRNLVGQIEVSLDTKSRAFYLAYTTFRDHLRKRYANEACRKIIDHMFSEWKASRAIIEMDVRNTASVRLAESIGARRVAFMPRVQLLKEEWSDEFRYEVMPT